MSNRNNNVEPSTESLPFAKLAVSSSFIGEIGQKLEIKGKYYFIGDIVLLTDRKTGIKKHYQIIWSNELFQVFLENENNRLASVHPSGSYWHTQAYIPLVDISESKIPYVDIERIGNTPKDLKLIKRISRTGMKRIK